VHLQLLLVFNQPQLMNIK